VKLPRERGFLTGIVFKQIKQFLRKFLENPCYSSHHPRRRPLQGSSGGNDVLEEHQDVPPEEHLDVPPEDQVRLVKPK
jgi:hypothetical protein